MASKTRVQICAIYTRAPATALLGFLYKWMPLHLVYTIAMLDGLTKRAIEFEFAMRK